MADKRAAKAIIQDEDGYALSLERSATHPYIPHTPDLPGGTLDGNEDAREALIRELREEIGFDASKYDIDFISQTVVKDYGRIIELFLYKIVVSKRPEITLSFEHSNATWIPLGDLSDAGFFNDPIKRYLTSLT